MECIFVPNDASLGLHAINGAHQVALVILSIKSTSHVERLISYLSQKTAIRFISQLHGNIWIERRGAIKQEYRMLTVWAVIMYQKIPDEV